MKALIKKKAEKGLWMEEVPVPRVNTNEVLIRIKKTAICGSDLHIYQWNEWARRTISPPLVIGHEFVGEVEEVGAGVTHYKKGDKVSGEGHVTCGNCRNCRAGKSHLCRKGFEPQAPGIPVSDHRQDENQESFSPDDSKYFRCQMDPYGNRAGSSRAGRQAHQGVLAPVQ